MERRAKCVKERIKDFDDAYRARGRCCKEHAGMLPSLIGSVRWNRPSKYFNRGFLKKTTISAMGAPKMLKFTDRQ
jgi:hypothetical protein